MIEARQKLVSEESLFYVIVFALASCVCSLVQDDARKPSYNATKTDNNLSVGMDQVFPIYICYLSIHVLLATTRQFVKALSFKLSTYQHLLASERSESYC